MGVSTQELIDIIDKTFASDYLKLKDIPNLDLYIDQITTLFENALSDRKRSENEKILTKTMVNNYSKEGILRPIKSKKYSREHIIQMSMIYLMKQILSIQDIKQIFCSNECQKLESFEAVYEKYAQFNETHRKTISDFFISFCENMNTENDEDLLASILFLCHISSALESVVETIIDKHLSTGLTDNNIKEKK